QCDLESLKEPMAEFILMRDYIINILAVLFFDIVFLMFLRTLKSYREWCILCNSKQGEKK
ncbi:MAG: hypothetical protein IIW14_06685, partial [Kiritimatiellae bacterium]|nr:hypothetical protein [Kiritimatiellia bacterium]